jgi:hypothetical protein
VKTGKTVIMYPKTRDLPIRPTDLASNSCHVVKKKYSYESHNGARKNTRL